MTLYYKSYLKKTKTFEILIKKMIKNYKEIKIILTKRQTTKKKIKEKR